MRGRGRCSDVAVPLSPDFVRVIGRDRLIRLEQGGDVDRPGGAGRPVQPVFEPAQERAGLLVIRGARPINWAGGSLFQLEPPAPVADQQPLELGMLARLKLPATAASTSGRRRSASVAAGRPRPSAVDPLPAAGEHDRRQAGDPGQRRRDQSRR